MCAKGGHGFGAVSKLPTARPVATHIRLQRVRKDWWKGSCHEKMVHTRTTCQVAVWLPGHQYSWQLQGFPRQTSCAGGMTIRKTHGPQHPHSAPVSIFDCDSGSFISCGTRQPKRSIVTQQNEPQSLVSSVAPSGLSPVRKAHKMITPPWCSRSSRTRPDCKWMFPKPQHVCATIFQDIGLETTCQCGVCVWGTQLRNRPSGSCFAFCMG